MKKKYSRFDVYMPFEDCKVEDLDIEFAALKDHIQTIIRENPECHNFTLNLESDYDSTYIRSFLRAERKPTQKEIKEYEATLKAQEERERQQYEFLKKKFEGK